MKDPLLPTAQCLSFINAFLSKNDKSLYIHGSVLVNIFVMQYVISHLKCFLLLLNKPLPFSSDVQLFHFTHRCEEKSLLNLILIKQHLQ